jgi:uncharacterized membrane protein
MDTSCSRLAALHRFLAGRAFYPLALSSGLAVALVAGRVLRTGEAAYTFMVWNLFLAWLPYLFSLWAALAERRRPGQWWRLLLPGALWLLFLPNGPYIVTDIIHLRRIQPAIWWLDVGLIATFAWTGCFLAVASLHAMQELVRRYLGAALSWLFVLLTLPLSGLGVYLGRFERLNSWNVLTNPREVLGSVVETLLHPGSQPRALGVTLLFAGLLFVCYLMFVAFRRPEGARVRA